MTATSECSFCGEDCGHRSVEMDEMRTALTLADQALRDRPMQAFRTEAAHKRRARAIDAVRAALGQNGSGEAS